MMRLDKYLSESGIGSRDAVKKMIRSGRVAVAGIARPAPETKIDFDQGELTGRHAPARHTASVSSGAAPRDIPHTARSGCCCPA